MRGKPRNRGVLNGAQKIRLNIPGPARKTFCRMGDDWAHGYGVEAMYKAVDKTLPMPRPQTALIARFEVEIAPSVLSLFGRLLKLRGSVWKCEGRVHSDLLSP